MFRYLNLILLGTDWHNGVHKNERPICKHSVVFKPPSGVNNGVTFRLDLSYKALSRTVRTLPFKKGKSHLKDSSLQRDTPVTECLEHMPRAYAW